MRPGVIHDWITYAEKLRSMLAGAWAKALVLEAEAGPRWWSERRLDESRRDGALEELDRVRPWLFHLRACPAAVNSENPCLCGLRTALASETEVADGQE